uniref:ShKT domain-containing protein n=1 Tax=Globodera pallida TaxID=36090 RepID=A0A183C816_GLOPA
MVRFGLWPTSPLSAKCRCPSFSGNLFRFGGCANKKRGRRWFVDKAPRGSPRAMPSSLKCLLFCWLFLLDYVALQNPSSFRLPSRRFCPGGFPFDKFVACFQWAVAGACVKNRSFMQLNCAPSCGACPDSARFSLPLSANAAVTVQSLPFPVNSDCSARVQTLEIATRIVPSVEEYENRFFRMGCATMNQENICVQNNCYHERYRTFDGSCNDLQHSLKGAAYMPFARLLPSNFEDGIARMVGTSKQMPNPRAVTHLLLSSSVSVLTRFNGLLMQFGQFLSHDVTRNTVPNLNCNCAVFISEECVSMAVPSHDTRLQKKLKDSSLAGCIPFKRSGVLCGTGSGRTGPGRTPRTPVNMNSAWVDASQIYGNEPKAMRTLRAGALLRTLALRMPPFSAVPPLEPTDKEKLLVGDNRNNLFVGLATLHTLFVRYHNMIATKLFQLNTHWETERVYQETRKIVGAIMQVITYQEFLPSLLGGRLAKHIPPYNGYQPNQEAAVAVEFAGAAYRLHGLIQEFYVLADRSFRKIGDVKFVTNAGNVDLLLLHGTDQLIRGMMMIASKEPQRLTPGVTDELFDVSDMGSLNIQRGRDQGIRPYNDYREICGMPRLKSLQEWPG